MEGDGDSEAGNYGRMRTAAAKKKKKRQGQSGIGNCNGMKKGFSDDQVKMLETMFETETKPEQGKKVELARELGLQPRQVAIWFQNRRARWKSKQLEREYRVLKCNYDELSAEYESLKKEKQSLRSELQRLSCMLGRTCDGAMAGEDDPKGTVGGGGGSDHHDAKSIGGHECLDSKRTFCPQMYDGMIENSVKDVCELLNVAGDEDDGGSLIEIPEKWCSFGSNETSAAQWWNFSSVPE